MSLTPEQQSQVDMSIAMDAARHEQQMAIQSKQAKLEAVRLAKEVLLENARSKAVSDRDVAAADITIFAALLVEYIET
jgi:D-ribose pyranose/furanose isomerase RbsD